MRQSDDQKAALDEGPFIPTRIRERFDLKGAPIRLQLKRTDNPFAEKE